MTNDSLSNTYGSAQGGAAATDASSSPTKDLRGDVSALASDAGDAGRRVADVAKDETRSVASETRRQAGRFMGQVGDELSSQAASQQARVAEGLQAMGSEFSEMAHSASGSGYATELVRGAGERADAVARWLEARDPRSIVEEVEGLRSTATRRVPRDRGGRGRARRAPDAGPRGAVGRFLVARADDSAARPRARRLGIRCSGSAPGLRGAAGLDHDGRGRHGRRRASDGIPRRPAHPPPHRPLTPACRPGRVEL